MNLATRLALVGLGGGIGASLRYVTALALPAFHGFWAYGFINLSGSFALGLLMAWSAQNPHRYQAWTAFGGTGILGGYTTFSTLALLVWQHQSMGWIFGLLSVLLGLWLSSFGAYLVNRVLRSRSRA